VFGANSEKIAEELARESGNKVFLIVEDYDSYMNSNLILENNDNVLVRMMTFESTDFKTSGFDLVYAQASISGLLRNKIVKEIKRILKPDGYLYVGEIIALSDNIPVFIQNLWNDSGLVPMHKDKLNRYYEERNFNVLFVADLSRTLRNFYWASSNNLKDQQEQLSEDEKIYNKKLLKRISHETNVYLRQGGDKIIGFKVLLLQKNTTHE
ncbi:MAG: methyltransferase domain-containing protein, partial [Ignavibacteria bacterium]